MSTKRIHVATDTVIALQDKGATKIDAIDTVVHAAKLTDDEASALTRAVNTFYQPTTK
jgi:hypothetical protein